MCEHTVNDEAIVNVLIGNIINLLLTKSMIASVAVCMRSTAFTSSQKYFHENRIFIFCQTVNLVLTRNWHIISLCYPSILFPRAVGLFLSHFCVSGVVFICLAMPDIEFYRINFREENDFLSMQTLEPRELGWHYSLPPVLFKIKCCDRTSQSYLSHILCRCNGYKYSSCLLSNQSRREEVCCLFFGKNWRIFSLNWCCCCWGKYLFWSLKTCSS